MSEQGLGLAMVENELGFLWDDQQNQFSWENLSNKSSGGGCGEEEEEYKAGVENKNLGSHGGSKGNYEKAEEGPPSNKKRSRGGGCKKKKTTTTTTNSNKSVEENDINGDGGGGGGDHKVESDHEIHIWTERERRKKMRNMFSNLHALLPQLPAKADKSTIVDEAVTYIKALEETLSQLKKQKLEKLNNGASPSPSTSNITSAFTCEPSLLTLQVNKPSNYNNYDNINDAISTREAYLADHNHNDLMTMGTNNNSKLQVESRINVPATFQTWTSSNVVLNISGNEAHINIVCSPKKPGLFSSICYVLEKNNISLVSAQLSSDTVRYMFMIHAHANSSETSDQFDEAFNSVEEIFKQAVGEIMYWISS